MIIFMISFMKKKYFYINGLGLIGLVWISISFAIDSSSIMTPPVDPTGKVIGTYTPVNYHPLVMDSGHIEGTTKNTEYDADGNAQTTNTCPSGGSSGGECFDTHPNTLCPPTFSPYVTLSQYAGWGNSQAGMFSNNISDLMYAYSVCIPEGYGGQNIRKKTNNYQVSYYSVDRLYTNPWPMGAAGPGPPYASPYMSFSWTLYCFPPGMTRPKLDSWCGTNHTTTPPDYQF